MDEHLVVFFVMAMFGMLLIAWLIREIIFMPLHFFKAKTQRIEISLRADCIKEHGWPTPPVNAFGDIVYPPLIEKEEDGEE